MVNIIKMIEIPAPPGMVSKAQRQLASEDLLPVPPEKREWTKWSYLNFWIADSFNVNTFAIASGGIAAGLSWWQALIATAVGYSCAAPFLVLNGRQGAVFHIKFPVVARAAFGIYGSFWVVLNRTMMSCVWWGVQSWIGGECIVVLLTAMSSKYNDIPNTFSESSGTTTKAWIGFFLFWLISLPTIWPPIEKARHFFTAKAIVAPIGGLTFMIWSLVRAHGGGSVIHEPSALTGSDLTWPMVSAIMSCMANMATLVTNNPDITSYADRPSSALWPQLVTLPLGFTLTSLVGIIIASCSKAIYGAVVWDPIQNLAMTLEGNPSGGERFGCAFIAICFIYVQLILNLSANSIGAGCDMSALFPRFVNIRRGSYVCAVVGIAYCPWNLFSSSNNFETYLSAYSVLLSSVAGTMIAEYYIVRRGHYRVTDLYTNQKSGWYTYTWGINFRAFFAYACGMLPNMPGLVNAVTGTERAGINATHLYEFSWWTGVAVSMAVYTAVNYFFPSAGAFPPGGFREIDESDYEINGLHQMPVSHDEAGTPTEEYEEKKYGDGGRMAVVELGA